MPLSKANLRSAQRHLRQADPVMRKIIDQVGPARLRAERNRFAMLVRSIISQQISVGAARSIRKRLEALVAPGKLTPENLQQFTPRQLRSAGLSQQKTSYILDLARKTSHGEVVLRTIGRRSDEDVIQELTQVKGIGRWTAQMFLMFALGRPDVFPAADLGIRMAIRDQYNLDDLPDNQTSHEIAQPWHPYATVASWYLWQSIDMQRQKKNDNQDNPT